MGTPLFPFSSPPLPLLPLPPTTLTPTLTGTAPSSTTTAHAHAHALQHIHHVGIHARHAGHTRRTATLALHLAHHVLEGVLADAAAGHGSRVGGQQLGHLPAPRHGGARPRFSLGVDIATSTGETRETHPHPPRGAAQTLAEGGGGVGRGVGDEVLGDGEVEVVLVLDGVGAGAGFFQGYAHAAWVRPVFGVRAVGLEDGREAERGAGVGDLAREGVDDG